jgi:hypothetical protein
MDGRKEEVVGRKVVIEVFETAFGVEVEVKTSVENLAVDLTVKGAKELVEKVRTDAGGAAVDVVGSFVANSIDGVASTTTGAVDDLTISSNFSVPSST